jgi:hypothetical protein
MKVENGFLAITDNALSLPFFTLITGSISETLLL